MEDRKQLAQEIVGQALAAGASAAEVIIREGTQFSTLVRLSEIEKLLQASFRKLGVRLYDGSRAAVSASSDYSPQTIRAMVLDTLGMARAQGADPALQPPDKDLFRGPRSEMRLAYPGASLLGAEEKIEIARRCEQASLSYDARIHNSEGAGFEDTFVQTSFANSCGVCDSYARTEVTVYTQPLAEMNGQKQRDYWLSKHLDLARLESAEAIGEEAARRALRRLGARKIQTCRVPIVLDPLTTGKLLNYVSEAVSGTALMRKSSFLLDRLGTRIASPLVTMVDDALREGGLGSRPFDSEGIPSQTTTVIRDGVLESYLLDTYSARKLGLRSTANSQREPHSPPKVGPSNFYLKPGTSTSEEIVSGVRRGLFVTDLVGFGVNIVTGDFSQGASGLWIENGELAFPVEEITVAGNLKDMLTSIEAVGNDLLVLDSVFAPTIQIGSMMVSGN